MDNNKFNNEIVKFSYDIAKGNYIENVYYEYETERAVKFKRKLDNKYCRIPKSFLQKGWKKDKNIPQNIYIKSYFAFLRIFWRDHENMY